MSVNKTVEIFNLAVAETFTDGRNGLSMGATNQLAGCAGQHATTEEEFVKEVLNQAENFTSSVEGVIETVEGGDGDSKKADLKVLKQMLGWTFNPAELEKMAREDWAENQGVNEEQ